MYHVTWCYRVAGTSVWGPSTTTRLRGSVWTSGTATATATWGKIPTEVSTYYSQLIIINYDIQDHLGLHDMAIYNTIVHDMYIYSVVYTLQLHIHVAMYTYCINVHFLCAVYVHVHFMYMNMLGYHVRTCAIRYCYCNTTPFYLCPQTSSVAAIRVSLVWIPTAWAVTTRPGQSTASVPETSATMDQPLINLLTRPSRTCTSMKSPTQDPRTSTSLVPPNQNF